MDRFFQQWELLNQNDCINATAIANPIVKEMEKFLPFPDGNVE